MVNFRIVLLLLVLSVVFSFCSWSTLLPVRTIKANEVPRSLKVYVIALSGVASYRMENLSEVVEGVCEAAVVNKTDVRIGGAGWKQVEFNVVSDVVMEWAGYKVLVEFGVDVIIVNAHGEYLPVPADYSREEWVGKIANAMLNRQVTWVHTGGYPFYRVQYQNGEIETWGEKGFQELMRYIGKSNVNCKSPSGCSGWADASYYGTRCLDDWRMDKVDEVNPTRPLKRNDFKDLLILNVYDHCSDVGTIYPGAVIRFSLVNETSNFGFYVHLGAWKFQHGYTHEEAENADFYMGYIPTAAAIWSEVGFSTYMLYYDIPEDIETASATGRTQGLDQAESLLQQAVDAYEQGEYKTAIALAYQARETARSAVKPIDYLVVYGPYVLFFGIVGSVAVQVIWKKKSNARLRRLGYIKCPMCTNYIAPDRIEEHKNLCYQKLIRKNDRARAREQPPYDL
jgi:hypothetical protein